MSITSKPKFIKTYIRSIVLYVVKPGWYEVMRETDCIWREYKTNKAVLDTVNKRRTIASAIIVKKKGNLTSAKSVHRYCRGKENKW